MTDIYITIPRFTYDEGTTFVATANFRSGDASAVPTTARYRVDCKTTGKKITDWTTLTPAASISITMSADDNQIVSTGRQKERRQLTVESDTDLSTQTRERIFWTVRNIEEF